jgi:2-polyprenyl-3-methyl-5-hydroxy-6-metoxy-1,4-benzoquinol methylase
MDVGKKLLKEVAKKCTSERVVGSILEMPFKKNTFDVVTCSEVIEHVTDPQKAIAEMYRVLKPGGILFLTTPNAFWHFSLRIAEAFHVRPYQGLENWQSQTTLRRMFEQVGFQVKEISGIHAFPFVVPALNPLLDVLHRWRKPLGPLMVNIAIAAVKPKP